MGKKQGGFKKIEAQGDKTKGVKMPPKGKGGKKC